MQHLAVRRVAWGIVAGLGIVAWLFGLALRQIPGRTVDAGRPPAPERRGAATFERYCAACHQPQELAGRLVDPADAAEWVGFLGTHGRAPLADDLAIVGWLVENRGREP